MKKLILLVIAGLLMGLNANAQYAYQENLKYSFGGVCKDVNGQKLSQQDLQSYFNPYQYADYLNAARKFKTGVIVSGVGAGCILLSAVGAAVILSSDNLIDFVGGTIVYGGVLTIGTYGGVILLATGIPIMLVQNHKMMNVVNDYNKQQNVSLSLGLQQYGYGLALKF